MFKAAKIKNHLFGEQTNFKWKDWIELNYREKKSEIPTNTTNSGSNSRQIESGLSAFDSPKIHFR